MPDYSNGKIYTIRCRTNPSLIYVGSTVEPLSIRLAKHRAQSKIEKCKNRILYQNVNGNWNDWYIELCESYPSNSREELNKREGEIIREIGTLNKMIAGRTKTEYRQDNKEIIKEYHDNNKDKKAIYDKEYKEKHKDKYQKQYKEYYENNKEKKKEYYENNKEGILLKINEKIVCDCGCRINRGTLSRHKKSQKHLSLLASNSQ